MQRKRKQDHVGSSVLAASSSLQPPTGTPRPRLLHLFAGPPGRPDGLKAILHKVGWDCQECDILNQGATYPQDLSDDHTWTQIFDDCQRGTFDAVWMGPECSTFSAARVNTPGPPPLRSKAHPYGLPDMVKDHKYKEQIRRANYFATQCAKLAQALHAKGIPWAIEQPEPRPHVASMFDLHELQLLSQLEGVVDRDFDQCTMGSETKKPTRIREYRLNLTSWNNRRCQHAPQWHTYTDLKGRTCQRWQPHPPSINRRRGNEFATKALAAYPGCMNRQIAKALTNRGRWWQHPS